MGGMTQARQGVGGWQPGYSLPQQDYVSDVAFGRDLRLLGTRLWLLVDHASRIPGPGDYFLAEIGGESIIVVRAKDGSIRAHYNVCRHRGSRICLEEAGRTAGLVCPYHGWTYDLDGRLRGAPLMPPDFDKQANTLVPCNVRVEDGLIFLNLAENDPPDFEAFMAPFRDYLKIHALGETKVAQRRVYPTAANWKLLVENFFECYHCKAAHQAYCKVHDPRKLLAFGAGPGSGDEQLTAGYLPIFQKWQDAERASGRLIDMFSDDASSTHFRSAGRMPIGGDCLTESIDGRPVAPLIGEARRVGSYDGNQSGLVFNPVSTLLVSSDHAVIFKFAPKGPVTSDCEAIWLVHKDAEAGRDYDEARLAELWDVTLGEDKVITENNQKGILSSAYRPGRFSTQEQRIADFGTWYMNSRTEFA